MDRRIRRDTCPFCSQRVTVGAANRIYKHNDASGRYCVKGHGFKMQPVQRKETNSDSMNNLIHQHDRNGNKHTHQPPKHENEEE